MERNCCSDAIGPPGPNANAKAGGRLTDTTLTLRHLSHAPAYSGSQNPIHQHHSMRHSVVAFIQTLAIASVPMGSAISPEEGKKSNLESPSPYWCILPSPFASSLCSNSSFRRSKQSLEATNSQSFCPWN